MDYTETRIRIIYNAKRDGDENVWRKVVPPVGRPLFLGEAISQVAEAVGRVGDAIPQPEKVDPNLRQAITRLANEVTDVAEAISKADGVISKPDGALRSRDIFTYALAICEAKEVSDKRTGRSQPPLKPDVQNWLNQQQWDQKIRDIREWLDQKQETQETRDIREWLDQIQETRDIREWLDQEAQSDKDRNFRLETLFERAEAMQDKNGHFWWKWGDGRVKDLNAVEFCMPGAGLVWLYHKDKVSPEVQEILQRLLNNGAKACMDHQVPEKYTNIALMNAANLILLGKALKDMPDMDGSEADKVAREGYRRLDQFCIYTYEWGIHEYCSPTYTGVSLCCLGLIDRICDEKRTAPEDDRAKEQAGALLDLFWTDIALNRLSSSGLLGGAYSRKRGGYLKREDGIKPYLDVDDVNWVKDCLTQKVEYLHAIYPALTLTRDRPVGFKNKSDSPQRLVRQSWGAGRCESRTHYLDKGITLSSSSAGCGKQDLPLTVDFRTDEPASLRCCFVSDVENDPYGKRGDHHVPLLWAAAQNRGDALGLVLYRSHSKTPHYHRRLKSYFVMPGDRDWDRNWAWDGDWDRDWVGKDGIYVVRKGEPKRAKDIKDIIEKGFISLNPDEDALALRKDSTAVGVRVVWARTLKGRQAPVIFRYDKVRYDKFLYDDVFYNEKMVDAARLTIHHHVSRSGADRKEAWTNAGAALWVRIGSDLNTDEKFQDWCEKFAKAEVKERQVETEIRDRIRAIKHLRVEVKGQKGVLSVDTRSPRAGRFVTEIQPEPSQDVLEYSGKDEGRAILKKIDLIKTYVGQTPGAFPTQSPGYWEAEKGREQSPMTKACGVEASEGKYVWMPRRNKRQVKGSDVGSVTWRLNVPAGTYYIWGRVQTLTRSEDSFHVRIFKDIRHPIHLSAWVMGVHPRWTWVPVDLRGTGKSTRPTPITIPLGVPQGKMRLQLFAREAGAKIDRLFITSNAKERPT